MAVAKTQRNINIENPQTGPKVASTALPVGMWLEYSGGFLQPLTPSTGIVAGLNLCPIASTDTDYASNKLITYDGIDDVVDRWLMPVTNGTALASMIGSVFNVFTDSYGLNVAAGGAQFEVTKVISTTLVEVKVVKSK